MCAAHDDIAPMLLFVAKHNILCCNVFHLRHTLDAFFFPLFFFLLEKDGRLRLDTAGAFLTEELKSFGGVKADFQIV